MKYIYDNRGIALVTALLMVFISLAIIVGVLMLLNQGQKVSSLTRQYSTAREAAYGGAEFTGSEILRREIDESLGNPTTSATWIKSGTYGGHVTHNITEDCFRAKLTTSTLQWPVACNNTSTTNLAVSSDFTINLPGTASKVPFTVFVKVVDTRRGNTSLSSTDMSSDRNPALTTGLHVPYIYRIEFLSQRATNPDERAVLSGVMTW